MSSWIPDFGHLGLTLAAFIVAILVIVAIHEYGHYIVGRWCGIKAQTFSLGFGPVLARRTDRHGTTWQIAAIPLGGYVKFLGDENAASVGGQTPGGVNPRHTMLGAPLWARALTVAAGPVANFVLTVVLLTGLFMVQGQTAEPLRIARLTPLPPSYAQELRPGDQLLRINGQEAADPAAFGALFETLRDAPAPRYTVLRDGAEVTLSGPPLLPPIVGQVTPRSAGFAAGLRPGDVITAINDQPISVFGDIRAQVSAGQGAEVSVTLWRDGVTRVVALTPKLSDVPLPDGGFEQRYLIGFYSGSAIEFATEAQSPWLALKGAVLSLWSILSGSVSGLWHIVTAQISSCNLSSPVGIAETSGAMAAQGTISFIQFLAFLSAAVGLLNLFPIPILDGGHLLFHAVEAVTGAPPSDRVLRLAMAFGAAVLMTLMGVALLNDLVLCR